MIVKYISILLLNTSKIYNEPDIAREVTAGEICARNECTLVKAFNERIEWFRNFVNSWEQQILSNQLPVAPRRAEKP